MTLEEAMEIMGLAHKAEQMKSDLERLAGERDTARELAMDALTARDEYRRRWEEAEAALSALRAEVRVVVEESALYMESAALHLDDFGIDYTPWLDGFRRMPSVCRALLAKVGDK